MSIAATFRIETLPWRGYDDPGLPAGAWVAQANLDSDMSGGNNTIQFLFQLSADPLSSRLYNLEQWTIGAGATTDTTCRMQITNMGHLSTDRPLGSRSFAIPLLASPPAAGIDSAAQPLRRPIFLGAPSAAGNTAQIEFIIDNVSGLSQNVSVYGYIWEPRSILAAGGLRRPVEGLFGH